MKFPCFPPSIPRDIGTARERVNPINFQTETLPAILVEALRDAHRWLDELLTDSRLTLESLASREGRTVRSIRMTLSLAFLAPEIVKAAVEGRLPRGFGLKRLVDLPMAWPDQWRTLGLQTPAQA
jgi:site-specific DNA recombinase